MAKKAQLRETRAGTVINTTSKKQESAMVRGLQGVIENLTARFGLKLEWSQSWALTEIVAHLQRHYADVDFQCLHQRSSIKPDGGILSVVTKDGERHPILIAEKKNQGTNDLRALEGLKKQAQGNAIERLGKNVIGLKTAMMPEGIFPFVCFGDGCDFADGSSILDRVVTIAMFGHLNTTYILPIGPNGEFSRGSFYFRAAEWGEAEMAEIMEDIAVRSTHYYLAKYGEGAFQAAG